MGECGWQRAAARRRLLQARFRQVAVTFTKIFFYETSVLNSINYLNYLKTILLKKIKKNNHLRFAEFTYAYPHSGGGLSVYALYHHAYSPAAAPDKRVGDSASTMCRHCRPGGPMRASESDVLSENNAMTHRRPRRGAWTVCRPPFIHSRSVCHSVVASAAILILLFLVVRIF